MDVDLATARHWIEFHGQRHCFCSAGCKTKFDTDPDRYLSAASSRSEPPVGPGGLSDEFFSNPRHERSKAFLSQIIH